MRASAALALVVFALPVAACDSGDPDDPTPFDPSTVDYNTVTSLDFGDYVQPLLAARDVFATGEAASDGVAGSLSDYTWNAIFDGAAGETIIPFDEEGSFLIRFVEDLPAEAEIPYPNLRTLEPDELNYIKRWINAGAKNDGGVVPYADADPMHVLYACEQGQGQNSVALVDMERRRIIRRIYFDELGVTSGQYGPHHVVFEPDLSAWYVSLVNGGADRRGRILKLSTSLTMDPGAPAYLLGQSPSFTTPGMMAVDPVTDRLWVGRSTLSQAGTPNVGIFTRATMALEEEVTTPFDVPHALAISEDGAYVLTASLSGNQMASIRTADLEVQLMSVAGGAHELIHFAVHPATPAAASATDAHAGHDISHAGNGTGSASRHIGVVTLTSRSSDEVLFFHLNEDGTLEPDGTVSVGDGPYHAHLGHDGHTLLVPNQFGNSLSMVDINTRAVTPISNPANGPFARPHTPAPGMDGTTFWVTNSNNGPSEETAWTPLYRFLGPPDGTGVRQPQEKRAFGNLALFSRDGTLLKVIQLGPYPSGVEHPMHGGHAGMQGGHEGHGM